MDATQFFSLTNQVSSVAGESFAAVPSAKVEGRGAEFADLFKAQIQLQVRQEFAAPVGDQVELQVMPLGPTINLITPNSPLPDMFSLASFARAQGLDDEAVKTLFGQAPVDVEKKTVDPLQVSELILPDAQFDPLYMGSAHSVLGPVGAAKMDTKTVIPTGLMASFETAPYLGTGALVKISSSTPIGPIGPIKQEDVPGVENNVLRVRLEAPSEAITQKLSEISGSKEPLNWRALLASAALTSSSKGEIDPHVELLTVEVSPDLLADLEDARTDNTSLAFAPPTAVSGDSTKASTPTGDAGDLSQNSSAEHRHEQYQLVADRLGRAVAEKLMAQIERGEWKMQLRLQPESLGRIDVALEMHSGGLDALFSAENGTTRDLIAQGAGKLRDALTQSGMAVASVFVNGDQGRKSDGNPTSGRPFKGGTGASQDDEDDVMPVTNASKRISSSTDGLDVLA